jgi:hypothetical protein
MEKLEYWVCQIGPIDRTKVPFGGDSPLRQAVKNTWESMFDDTEYMCSSGWGTDQELLDLIRSLQFAYTHQPNKVKQIKKILHG